MLNLKDQAKYCTNEIYKSFLVKEDHFVAHLYQDKFELIKWLILGVTLTGQRNMQVADKSLYVVFL